MTLNATASDHTQALPDKAAASNERGNSGIDDKTAVAAAKASARLTNPRLTASQQRVAQRTGNHVADPPPNTQPAEYHGWIDVATGSFALSRHIPHDAGPYRSPAACEEAVDDAEQE